MVLLESSRPDLARGLEKRWGQECVAYVAARLSKTLGAERKLLRFLAEFMPDALRFDQRATNKFGTRRTWREKLVASGKIVLVVPEVVLDEAR